jgi:GNAT superfamily N-acetyltransferase
MGSELLIRTAVPADVPIIAEFNRCLAWETERKILPPATILAGVDAVVRDAAKGTYFVAEAGGQVVGQCSITFEWSDWRNGNIWWFQSVYVDVNFRSRGVFRSLFEHVQAAAVAAGVVALRLYVEGDNAVAQSAYSRRGMSRTNYQVYEAELGATGTA